MPNTPQSADGNSRTFGATLKTILWWTCVCYAILFGLALFADGVEGITGGGTKPDLTKAVLKIALGVARGIVTFVTNFPSEFANA